MTPNGTRSHNLSTTVDSSLDLLSKALWLVMGIAALGLAIIIARS